MSNEFKIERMHEYLKEGDTVVGSYSRTGAVLKPSTIKADEDTIVEFQQSVVSSASRVRGAEIRKKKKSKAKPAPVASKKKPRKRPTVEEEDQDEVMPLTPATTLAELATEDYQLLGNELEDDDEPVRKSLTPLREVELHNDFGRIKLFVEAVQEIEIAFMLVFRDAKDMIFIPAPGQTLNFKHNDETCQVYYADTVFPWTDGKRQVMILFKQINQDE